jgi:hypothetical protein
MEVGRTLLWGGAAYVPGVGTNYPGGDNLIVKHGVVVNSAITGTGGNRLTVHA